MASPFATPDQLLKPQGFREKVVDLAEHGIDISFRVRGLSKGSQINLRAEAMDVESGTMDQRRFDLMLFHEGVVEPELTEEQAQAAFDNLPAGAIDAVIFAVLEVSGMDGDFPASD